MDLPTADEFGKSWKTCVGKIYKVKATVLRARLSYAAGRHSEESADIVYLNPDGSPSPDLAT